MSAWVMGVTGTRPFAVTTSHAIAADARQTGSRPQLHSVYWAGTFKAECGLEVVKKFEDFRPHWPEPFVLGSRFRNCQSCERKIRAKETCVGPMIKYVIKGTEFAVWMNPRHEEAIATGNPNERLGGWATPDGPNDQLIVCAGWLQRADTAERPGP